MVQIPYRPELFPGLIFTTVQVVLISAKIAFIFKSLLFGEVSRASARRRNHTGQLERRKYHSKLKRGRTREANTQLVLVYRLIGRERSANFLDRSRAEKHEPKASTSRTSRVFARARSDDIGCAHYISTVHSCDVRRVLYGNIMNSF